MIGGYYQSVLKKKLATITGLQYIATLPAGNYKDAVVAPDGVAYFTATDTRKIERYDFASNQGLSTLLTLAVAPLGISLMGDTLLITKTTNASWYEVQRTTGSFIQKSAANASRKLIYHNGYYYYLSLNAVLVRDNAGTFLKQANSGGVVADIFVYNGVLYVLNSHGIFTLPLYTAENAATWGTYTTYYAPANPKVSSGRFLATPNRSIIGVRHVNLYNGASVVGLQMDDHNAATGSAAAPDDELMDGIIHYNGQVYVVTLTGKIYRIISTLPL
jgi:hypothetical protein